MDQLVQLLDRAQYACGIMGRPETGDYALVPANPSLVLPPDAIIQKGQREAWRLLGVIGTVDGKPRVALAEHLDPETLVQLTDAFLSPLITAALDHFGPPNAMETGDDFVRFMERLWALPDPRSDA